MDRRFVKTFHRLRIAARRILGYIHDVETQRPGILHGCLCSLEQKVVSPALGVAADWTRSQKSGGFNIQARTLNDFSNRTYIVLMGARRTIGTNLHFPLDDLARQCFHVLHCTLACSRKSEVERVDAQRFHQMQDMKFFLDRGIPHGWRLQSVTQSLIVEENPPGGTQRGGILLVPVVDKFGSFHSHPEESLPVDTYFSLGGIVRPNTESCPSPATFSPLGVSGLGRYNVLQCSQRYTSAFSPQAFATSPHPCSTASVM